MKIKVCSTILKPKQVQRISSKGDQIYLISPSSVFNEAVCTCPSFTHRGSCRHVTEVEEARCRWHSLDQDVHLEICPNCAETVEEYQYEIEYVDEPRND